MRIVTNVFNNKAFRVYAYVSMKLYIFYEKLHKKGKACVYERCSKPSFESKEFSRNENYETKEF